MPGFAGASAGAHTRSAAIPEAPVASILAMAVVAVLLALWCLYLYRGQGWRPHVIGYGLAALAMGGGAVWYFLARLT